MTVLPPPPPPPPKKITELKTIALYIDISTFNVPLNCHSCHFYSGSLEKLRFANCYSLRLNNFDCNCKSHTLVFLSLWVNSIGVMVFLLYKLYVLSPYPTPTPNTKPSEFLDVHKTSFCVIYKLFSSWRQKKQTKKTVHSRTLWILPSL